MIIGEGKSPLTQEEIEKIVERLGNRGARITMQDPRVSATTNWLLAAIGVTFITVGGWLISSVNELNKGLATVIQQNAYAQRVNDAQDNRLDSYDERLRSVERRVIK
jgi:cytochrome c-type biogenesis protein CcmH/NrfF